MCIYSVILVFCLYLLFLLFGFSPVFLLVVFVVVFCPRCGPGPGRGRCRCCRWIGRRWRWLFVGYVDCLFILLIYIADVVCWFVVGFVGSTTLVWQIFVGLNKVGWWKLVDESCLLVSSANSAAAGRSNEGLAQRRFCAVAAAQDGSAQNQLALHRLPTTVYDRERLWKTPRKGLNMSQLSTALNGFHCKMSSLISLSLTGFIVAWRGNERVPSKYLVYSWRS